MKLTYKQFAFTYLLIVGLIFTFTTAGCNSVDKLYKTVTTVTPASTNLVTGVVTPSWTNTVLAPDPVVETSLTALSALPIPYAGIVGILLTAAYGIYSSTRNKQALLSVVTGVEAFRKTLQTPELAKYDAQLKDFLIEHQELAGTLKLVSALVDEKTGNTVTTSPIPSGK